MARQQSVSAPARNFLRIAQGVDVGPLALELHRAPHLWDRDTTRTSAYANSPHRDTSDIWVRFRAKDEIKGPEAHCEPYRSVFWPAWQELPALRPIVFGLMARVSAVEMGSILITRLPPGQQVHPHTDGGFGWSPEFYNTKAHLTVSGASRSWCDGDSVVMQPGDVWTFDNLKMHSVESIGDVDRIAVIVSMRCE